jgi:alanine racemase
MVVPFQSRYNGHSMSPRSEVVVDLAAVDHNISVIRAALDPSVRLGLVLKSDAYGLGAARLARRVAGRADFLVVYGIEEAEVVGVADPSTPVIALMPVREIDCGGIAHSMWLKGQLHLSAHDVEQVESLSKCAADFGVVLPLHLEIDTGLGRGGCLPTDATKIAARIRSDKNLRLAGVFTHFANAGGSETATDQQRKMFEAWCKSASLPADCIVHSASTFAAIRDPRFHHHMIRVGLAWTGLAFEGTRDGHFMEFAKNLRPVFSWRSSFVQVRTVPAGTAVGYGSRWKCEKTSRIGLVPVGYGDGYPLLPMNPVTRRPLGVERRMVRVEVVEHGQTTWLNAPVVGAISMDQIAVDLSELPDALATNWNHAAVELISSDCNAPNHAARVASMTGHHAYELLCRIPARVPRKFVEPVVRELPSLDSSQVSTNAISQAS